MEKGAVIKHNIKKAADTGSWRYLKPVIDKDKCAGCGTCVKHCPEGIIKLRDRSKEELKKNGKLSKKVAEIDYSFCKGCGVCAQVCPFKAIKMEKEK
ncbi:4Fe-4S binding protein [bacterium]|nr:4Fe-4S binding protein [bacterium]